MPLSHATTRAVSAYLRARRYHRQATFPYAGPLAFTAPGSAAIMGTWALEAACASADPGISFPATGECDAAAKALCERCPVQADCLDYALATGLYWRVWGGLNEAARRALARRRQRNWRQARTALATGAGSAG